MSFLLSVLLAAAAAVLFFTPYGPQYAQYLQWGLVGGACLLALLQLLALVRGPRIAAPEPKEVGAGPVSLGQTARAEADAAVVQFLALLQAKGRLVDFALDDIAPYSNEQVGAAARVVHQGCREVLDGCFEIRPVHGGEEREEVVLSEDYDASAYRLVGKVPDQPPFRGIVLHRGWKTNRVDLPRVSDAAGTGAAREVIAPAEVEIP